MRKTLVVLDAVRKGLDCDIMSNTIREKYVPKSNLIMIVGNYGSGKTEVAVNLASELSESGKKVSIADLDIVNPYFRCREAQDLMSGLGIRVVLPPGAQQYADLPIVVPEIKGMLRPDEDEISIFDVGGDDVGARLLSSFRQALGDSDYSLLQVLNSKRPFTDSVRGSLQMKDSIEVASRLSVTGVISNSHLMEDTTPDVITSGFALADEVARTADIPVEMVTAMGELAEYPEITALNAFVFKLRRIMLPPWLRSDEKQDNPLDEINTLPAERTKPIFRP